MEKQLDLFENSLQENPTNDYHNNKIQLGTLWGSDSLNREYRFIRLITKCCKCGKGNTFNHFQIFKDEEMIEKGIFAV